MLVENTKLEYLLYLLCQDLNYWNNWSVSANLSNSAAPCVSDGIIPDTPMKGNIEFHDLYFSYPQRPDTDIFSGLTLSVPQGSVTAIVGSSGSGKSTLAALLLRYYDPNSGG